MAVPRPSAMQVPVLVQVPALVVEVVVGGERQQIVVERQISAWAINSFQRHARCFGQNNSFWRKGLKSGVARFSQCNIYGEARVHGAGKLRRHALVVPQTTVLMCNRAG